MQLQLFSPAPYSKTASKTQICSPSNRNVAENSLHKRPFHSRFRTVVRSKKRNSDAASGSQDIVPAEFKDLKPAVKWFTGLSTNKAPCQDPWWRQKQTQVPRQAESKHQADCGSPVYTLVAALAFMFALSQGINEFSPATEFGLSLKNPRLWQIISSGFMCMSSRHLYEVMFMTYVFGRLVERSLGLLGLWATFIASVVGANAAALWLLPQKAIIAPFATSAGVFGLFVAGLVLPRLLRKPLEVACLAPLVLWATMQQYAPLAGLATVKGVDVGHLVHLGGACLSASLIWSLLTISNIIKVNAELEEADRERREHSRQRRERASVMEDAMAEAMNTAALAASQAAKKFL